MKSEGESPRTHRVWDGEFDPVMGEAAVEGLFRKHAPERDIVLRAAGEESKENRWTQ